MDTTAVEAQQVEQPAEPRQEEEQHEPKQEQQDAPEPKQEPQQEPAVAVTDEELKTRLAVLLGKSDLATTTGARHAANDNRLQRRPERSPACPACREDAAQVSRKGTGRQAGRQEGSDTAAGACAPPPAPLRACAASAAAAAPCSCCCRLNLPCCVQVEAYLASVQPAEDEGSNGGDDGDDAGSDDDDDGSDGGRPA